MMQMGPYFRERKKFRLHPREKKSDLLKIWNGVPNLLASYSFQHWLQSSLLLKKGIGAWYETKWFLHSKLQNITRDIESSYFYRPQQDVKAWFPSMRLTYSHVYSYENKYNLIGGNALNNLKKKKILQFSMRLFTYSCNILIRLLRSKKDCWNISYFWRQFIENERKNKIR